MERCEIVVLGAAALGPSPLFDTVSYERYYAGQRASASFSPRHDSVGLSNASCAPAKCTEGEQYSRFSCYVSTEFNRQDPVAPAGCYAGTSGPPPGTELTVGEAVTWAAVGDWNYAYNNPSFYGAASNHASAHGGWELCFA